MINPIFLQNISFKSDKIYSKEISLNTGGNITYAKMQSMH